jgi:glycosyltransferase involved in cell wall biosynthesis
MSEKTLTICIPSYGRLRQVKHTIKALLTQIELFDAEILVLDNSSPMDYSLDFDRDIELKSAIESGVLTIVRNSANIGMAANFLRAFEVARSNWLWLLSDDDEVGLNALEQVMSGISTTSAECGFIKFGPLRSELLLRHEVIEDLQSFIDRNARSVDDFNEFLFISNGIYRLENFRLFLEVGYQHAHTYVPHFMMLTAFMSSGGRITLIDEEIVKYVIPKVGYSYGMLAGLGVGAPKSFLIKTTPMHVKKFYALFFPHHDFKVIIDLYFHCKRDASVEVFKYHVRNYIHLVSVARTPPQVFLINCFSRVGRIPFLFEFFLEIVEKASLKYGTHLREIKVRYGFLQLDERVE